MINADKQQTKNIENNDVNKKTRRDFLKKLGRSSVYAPPVLVALVTAKESEAQAIQPPTES